MINRKQAPHIYDPVEFHLNLPPYQKFTLDNGVEVYAVNAGEEEVIAVEWVFFAGNWFEEQNITAATTNFLLKNGTNKKKAFDISEHFEFYGAYLNRHCYNETATVSLHSLTKHLSQLLPVVAELLTESTFPEEELAIYKQNQKQRLEVNLRKCDFVANRLIDEYLYSFDHPYGRYTTMFDYDRLQRDAILKYFEHFYRNGKCIMFVAGKLPGDIQQQLNSVFGQLPFNNHSIKLPERKPSPATVRKHEIVNDANGVQGAVRLARFVPNRHHPDFPKLSVLNTVFGSYFGSRLMSNIREDKGYTYGIHSFLQNHIQSSALMVSTEAGRDVCRATITEVYKEMDLLRNEPIDSEELDLVRNFMIGSILGDLDGPFQVIARWKTYILNGLTEEYFNRSINIIKTISAEELQYLANAYLQPDDYYELVVI